MRNLLVIFLLFISTLLSGQNSLLDILNKDESQVVEYLFKGTKVVNGQSVELPSKDVLQFNIQHRFGPLNSGGYNLFGLDYAQVRFSLEYGLKDWISIGVGRSSFSKIIDANIQVLYKKQKNGRISFPFALASNSAIYIQQFTFEQAKQESFLFTNQLIYSNQILIARKISRSLSLQVSPTYIHYNVINANTNSNHDNFSLGLGGRYKITNRISINVEHFIQLYNTVNNNVLSFGFDIETGGHVFQLHISNSPSMIEPLFVTQTHGNFLKGDIYFGFNISRVFLLKK